MWLTFRLFVTDGLVPDETKSPTQVLQSGLPLLRQLLWRKWRPSSWTYPLRRRGCRASWLSTAATRRDGQTKSQVRRSATHKCDNRPLVHSLSKRRRVRRNDPVQPSWTFIRVRSICVIISGLETIIHHTDLHHCSSTEGSRLPQGLIRPCHRMWKAYAYHAKPSLPPRIIGTAAPTSPAEVRPWAWSIVAAKTTVAALPTWRLSRPSALQGPDYPFTSIPCR